MREGELSCAYSMESAPRKHVDWDTYAIGIPMIVWGASFFLPTLIGRHDNWFFPGATPGFMAPIASFFVLVVVIATSWHSGVIPPTPDDVFLYFSLSSLWMANFWMLLAPVASKRLRKGEGQSFLFTAWIWTLVPIPIAFKAFKNNSDIGGDIKIAVGFYVWWASFIFLALVCTAHFLRSRPAKLEPYPPQPR
jgi:hypothetical protein